MAEKPGFIVRLGGRLGNQMFQYAAGLALAKRTGEHVAFEGFGEDSSKKSRTQVFRSFGIEADFRPIDPGLIDKATVALAKHVPGCPVRLRGMRLFLERQFHYDPRFEQLAPGHYLIGRWQSARYFPEPDTALREAFSFHGQMSDSARSTRDRIAAADCSVSIHVRRGDYVENKRTLSRHGICGLEFYRRAMDYILGRHAAASFFVFSDDIDRARAEFGNTNRIHFAPPATQEEDLHLMALCRHNIIANSTYSWWSAWLNDTPEKIVVAPRQWFSEEMMKRKDIHDLFPEDWVLL